MQISMTDQKEMIVKVYDRSAPSYGKLSYYSIFGERLAEASNILEGESVLDVACGRGAILIPAAQWVGEKGKAIGVDLSSEMVGMTNSTLRAKGLKNAVAVPMDGGKLHFPDSSFDHVFCGFAIQFFPDLKRTVMEFYRVLKPAGHLSISTWGSDDERWRWYGEQLQAFGGAMNIVPNAITHPEDMSKAFRQAGFVEIKTWVEKFEWVYADEEEWWLDIMSSSGNAASESLSPSALNQFKAEAFQKMALLKQPDGYHNLLQANFLTDIKPF